MRTIFFGACVASIALLSNSNSVTARASAYPSTGAPSFFAQDLGTVFGYSRYRGVAINSGGHVAGAAYLSPNITSALDYTASGPVVLPGKPNARDTEVGGINDAGTIAGYSGTPYSSYSSYTWTSGVPTRLNPPAGWREGLAYAINSLGHVAGYAFPGLGAQHAVLWKSGTMIDLGVLNGQTSSQALAVNSNDVAAGDSGGVAVVFQQGSVTALGSLGGGFGSATAINDSGVVAGRSYTPGQLHQHAFLYNGIMRDLGTLPNLTESFATGINDLNHVVGFAQNHDGTGTTGFIYIGGKMLDLNSLLRSGSGWFIEQANAINESDQITGTGIHNHQKRAFLLTRTR